MKINNNIQESYCSFEVSKLLKEKGFSIITETYYKEQRPLDDYVLQTLNNTLKENYNHQSYAWQYLRPTHALAIEWIRVNFGVWITADIHQEVLKWRLLVTSKLRYHQSAFEFNSPQEAIEEALLYVLKNLI